MDPTDVTTLHGDHLIQIALSKEVEWKNLLFNEIQRLTHELNKLKDETQSKHDQFEQLKEAFTHNLRLLRERDTESAKLEVQVAAMKKSLHSKELSLSETKASLDRCHSDLSMEKNTIVRLRNELDLLLSKSSQREYELHQHHTAEIGAVKQTELIHRTQLETELTRLRSDIEAERLRFASDLDEALTKLTAKADQVALEASQKQFALEVRLQLSEEMCQRATRARQESMEQGNSKDAMISELNSRLEVTRGQMDALNTQIKELEAAGELLEQKQQTCEAVRSRAECSWEAQKCNLEDQLEKTKAQLVWHQKELNTATSTRDEAVTLAGVEKQRLLETLSRETQEKRKAISTLEEANGARRIAERTARTNRIEAERLRKDLEKLLLTPTTEELMSSEQKCGHQHLMEQMDRLQDNCDRLEEENARLRCSINAMSEQAKQVAHETTLEVQKGLENDVSSNDLEKKKLLKKLHNAVQMIQQLAQEKRSLIELSNRLHAQLREYTEKQIIVQDDGSGTIVLGDHRHDAIQLRESANQPVREICNRVPPLPVQEPDDNNSSVVGKESVRAIFGLLDDSASNCGRPQEDKPVLLRNKTRTVPTRNTRR